jgi:NAD(P)-dependent dehydrogenase (short-subunit alcohol dehydrogenase family)
MRIAGRTAIVTGASSGIGRETARELAAKSANVVLASRNRAKLEEVAVDLVHLPGRTLVVPTDVTDRLAVEALVRRTLEEFGAVDILVNNAGSGLFAPIASGSIENMRRIFDVNLWGAIHCIQAAVPYMQAQRRGHIVNVSSVAGRFAPPYMGAYAATKHALRAVSDALRNEISGSGVGVSTIYPGLTQTSFTEAMTQEVPIPHIPPVVRFVPSRVVAQRIASAIRWNLRDVFVSPEDVAAVVGTALAPHVFDWVARAFMGPQQISDEMTLPRSEAHESHTADAEPGDTV